MRAEERARKDTSGPILWRIVCRGCSSVVFAADAPSEEEVKNSGDVIFIHYLLVEGKACCAHVYANFEKHPLRTEDCVAEVFDMPWDEANGKHAFPGLA